MDKYLRLIESKTYVQFLKPLYREKLDPENFSFHKINPASPIPRADADSPGLLWLRAALLVGEKRVGGDRVHLSIPKQPNKE